MDNITHAVVGLATGELIHRSLPAEPDLARQSKRRSLLLASCAIASNFPDLDLVLTPLLPAPLGYLLHHRGHTHTILYAIPQALLLFALLWALWPSARRLLRQSSTARKGLGLSLLVGFSLHLLMDYLNSYGIHPLHPFDSRWFYGDMVFIIEPVFWVAFGVPMAMMVKRRWLKTVFLAFLLGVPGVFAVTGFIPWISVVLLFAIAWGLARTELRAGPSRSTSLIAAAMIAVVFVGLQSYMSGLAKREVIRELATLDASARLLDSAMSSYPANPFCWGFVSVENNETAGTYRLRRGLMSLAPSLVPVARCPSLLADMKELRESSKGFALRSEFTGQLAELRKLAKENCHFEAWMRFARAPIVTESDASDMRFQIRGPRGDFTRLDFERFKNQECSKLIPQWGFPREDLLKHDAK